MCLFFGFYDNQSRKLDLVAVRAVAAAAAVGRLNAQAEAAAIVRLCTYCAGAGLRALRLTMIYGMDQAAVGVPATESKPVKRR